MAVLTPSAPRRCLRLRKVGPLLFVHSAEEKPGVCAPTDAVDSSLIGNCKSLP